MPDDNLGETYKRERGNSSGTETFYTVECRCPGSRPIVVLGQAITSDWLPVQVDRGPVGVPVSADWRNIATQGHYTYAAAQAIRWWFLAEAERCRLGMFVETRLVKHETNYMSLTTAVAAVEPTEWPFK